MWRSGLRGPLNVHSARPGVGEANSGLVKFSESPAPSIISTVLPALLLCAEHTCQMGRYACGRTTS
jgi:hypothetical protein